MVLVDLETVILMVSGVVVIFEREGDPGGESLSVGRVFVERPLRIRISILSMAGTMWARVLPVVVARQSRPLGSVHEQAGH
jgi:hypothetical protein